MTSLRPCFEIALTHAGNSVVLRASLRAAVAIDLLDGGLPAVLERLAGQSYTATCEVIRASATDREQAERFIAATGAIILQGYMPKATAACLELIAHALPTSDDKAKASSTTRTETTGKPWAAHFTDLYRYATGWLGWPPEAVWNASVDEITAAFTARIEHLVAVNGGKPDDEEPDMSSRIYSAERLAEIMADDTNLDPTFDRNALRALKSKLGA